MMSFGVHLEFNTGEHLSSGAAKSESEKAEEHFEGRREAEVTAPEDGRAPSIEGFSNGLDSSFKHNRDVLKVNSAPANMETLDAGSLLERARGGDADAFCALCRTLETRLLRQAMSLCGNASLAEDLAQETLIEGWKCLRRYNGRCQFFTWLCAILLNRHRNVLRKERSLPISTHSRAQPNDAENRAGQVVDPEPSPDEVVEQREQAALVHECIQALPQKHQDVIYLRFYVDDSLEGIAAALDCSLGTVKSRLFHALEKLRSMRVLNERLRTEKRTLELYETLF
jgi:RNA polymerase sigma-70 factor (ECF subfamily)